MTAQGMIEGCDAYLAQRTGKYEWRRIRYSHAIRYLLITGLSDESTVIDIGAGWTEFGYCLHAEAECQARYIPVDGCIDGTDLNSWEPPRSAEHFVALELLEHLRDPGRLVAAIQASCTASFVISTPNPETTDVLGMDPTHVTAITAEQLGEWGFKYVEPVSFYGAEDDSLFGIWTPETHNKDKE